MKLYIILLIENILFNVKKMIEQKIELQLKLKKFILFKTNLKH